MGILQRTLGLERLSAEPEGDYDPVKQVVAGIPSRNRRPRVTPESAITLPAVFRSIQISAGMAAELPLDSWRNKRIVERPPAVIRQPDPWRPLGSWTERVVIGMMTDGNAFLRKYKDDSGEVVAAPALNPFRVRVLRDKHGRKYYEYHHEHTGHVETLTDDQVLHLWGLEVPGQDRGLGPIGYCRTSVQGALDTRDYAGEWFQTGAIPPGVLTTDKTIDKTAAKAYKEAWHEGDPSEVRVLGSGLSFDPIMLRPADAQWIEAQRWGVLDIARMFGLPAPYLIAAVEGTAMTYQNLEQIDAQFLRTTLFPVYLRKIEAALTSLLPHGQRARYDTSELLRPDARIRMNIHATAIESGIYSPTEARHMEGIDGEAPGIPDTPTRSRRAREDQPA